MCEITVYEESEREVIAKRCVGSISETGKNWQKFAKMLNQQGFHYSEWGIEEYHSEVDRWNPENFEYELMLPVHEDHQPDEPLYKKTLPAGKVASIIFRGAFDKMGEYYKKLAEWIAKNDLQIDGNVRIVHLRCPRNTNHSDGLVTEIQIPVK